MIVSCCYWQGRLNGVTERMPGLCGMKKSIFSWDSKAEVSSH